ncbi:hypothetical protein DFH06DRAFT_1295745, partial [Mycena polygramma]
FPQLSCRFLVSLVLAVASIRRIQKGAAAPLPLPQKPGLRLSCLLPPSSSVAHLLTTPTCIPFIGHRCGSKSGWEREAEREVEPGGGKDTALHSGYAYIPPSQLVPSARHLNASIDVGRRTSAAASCARAVRITLARRVCSSLSPSLDHGVRRCSALLPTFNRAYCDEFPRDPRSYGAWEISALRRESFAKWTFNAENGTRLSNSASYTSTPDGVRTQLHQIRK